MPFEVFVAVVIFAGVAAFTPGPNNIMVLASGVNFGFARTLPHMFGILVGFAVLIGSVGAGLGALFTAFPALHTAMKIIGAGYLLYLAWRIAMSRSVKEADATAKPLTFLEAAAFQWVNPKAWIMGMTAVALFTQVHAPVISIIFIVLAFALVTIPAVALWTAFGTALRGFLSDPARLKWFNMAMGVLFVASLYPMLT